MSEWRTIDSAPKDGTHILVYAKIFPEFCVAFWQNDSFLPVGWTMHPTSETWAAGDVIPTHWMPLPPAPTHEKDG